ncbi:MAG: dephospho-CoA kinase [Lentisphaerae bacterium]|nr:dephospho-CoA kinase [Lentisphaerota bacterium]
MILGITGGFGCGKSSVLRFFESRSWFTLDADAVCRSFYDQRNPLLMKCIKDNFGAEMFADDNSVDRKKLATLLFEAPEKMQIITSVIYPMLTAEVDAAIARCRKNNVHGAFELPLLYEAGFEKNFDAVLAIWCPAELRKKHLINRNFTQDEVIRRDKMQMDPDLKLEKADYGIINSGTENDLISQLETLAAILENQFIFAI